MKRFATSVTACLLAAAPVATADEAAAAHAAPRTLTFENLQQDWLVFPLSVYESIPETWVEVRASESGPIVGDNMHFTPNGPTWTSSLDVSPYRGQDLSVHGVPAYAAEQVYLSDAPVADQPGGAGFYEERNRPKYHFSFRQGVLGDPTAKFYYEPDGTWHQFFIYNPFRGWESAWGHAVSKDLLRWEERAPVFTYKNHPYNGVGIVDTRNDLGLNTDEHQAILLLRTHKNQPGGAFAYVISLDGGHTWEEVQDLAKRLNRDDLPSNPIQPGWHDAPRIYFSEGFERYVLYLKHAHRVVHQYLSDDLKTWEQIEDAPAVPESYTFEGDPGEIVDLALDGDPEQIHQVVMYGLHGYIVGRYGEQGMLNLDGEPIDKEDLILTAHFGYPTVWQNAPGGRVIMNQNLGNDGMGGIPNYEVDYYPDASVPVELKLVTTDEGPRLRIEPIAELETLHGDTVTLEPQTLRDGKGVQIKGTTGHALRIRATIKPHDADEVGFALFGTQVRYDVKREMLGVRWDPSEGEVGRKRRTVKLNDDGTLSLDLLIDTTSIEAFANGGAAYIPHGRLKNYQEPEDKLYVFANGGDAELVSLEAIQMESIWDDRK